MIDTAKGPLLPPPTKITTPRDWITRATTVANITVPPIIPGTITPYVAATIPPVVPALVVAAGTAVVTAVVPVTIRCGSVAGSHEARAAAGRPAGNARGLAGADVDFVGGSSGCLPPGCFVFGRLILAG